MKIHQTGRPGPLHYNDTLNYSIYFQTLGSTSFLTDIVMGNITVHVVPQEVSEDGDKRIVELRHGEAVLAVEIIRLTLSPVEPLDGFVGVRPEPLPGSILIVSLLSRSS